MTVDNLLLIWCIVVIASFWKITAIDSSQCDLALGMENGNIRNEQLSASSSYINGNVGPQHGRLGNELDGGAWCPKITITNQPKEWLQIDLGSIHMIVAAATQGRFGNGQGVEFSEAYMLEYWRPNLGKWQKYRNISGTDILTGNVNTYTVQKNFLEPVILASKIRFIPYSYHERTVCMRVELYGCKWNEGVLSYSMPQGDVRGNWKFFDITYDGIWNDKGLQKGLGQLTDGKFSPDDFRFVSNSLSVAHHLSGSSNGVSPIQFQADSNVQQWVGWRSDVHNNEPIEILFEFDQIRVFSAMHIFCNNQFTKEIQIFSEARLWFNNTGPYFYGQPLSYEYPEDRIFENARNVTIHLHRRIGKFIKVQLYFSSKWILISEIVFDSEIVQEGFTIDPQQVEDENRQNEVLNQKEIKVKSNQKQSSIVKKDESIYMTIIIGVLTSVILLLTITMCIIMNRKRGQKFFENALKASTSNGSAIPQKNSLYTAPADIISDNYHYQQQQSFIQKKTYMDIEALQTNNNSAFPVTDSLLGRIDDYQEPYQALKYSPYYSYSTVNMELQNKSSSTSTTTATNSEISHDYATPEIGLKPLLEQPQSPRHNNSRLKSNSKQNFSRNKSPVKKDMVKDLKMRLEQTNVPEFPRHRLRMLRKLSEGNYGTVYIAEADGIPDYKCANSSTQKRLVALKFLMKSATEKEKKEFHRDVKILAALEDANITRVLGMCSLEDPLCVVMEYLEHGDLCHFLKAHVSTENICDITTNVANHLMTNSLSYNCLLYISTQIASGMRYLETLNFVHRDLATRNCLVGKGYQVKICDFGTDNDLYADDYFKVDGAVPLPIRWMAWESVFYARYTIKSDVWAFGVTFWEILNMCRFIPFHTLNNEQVLENLSTLKTSLPCNNNNNNLTIGGNAIDADQEFIFLPRPVQATTEVYDLMLSCWHRNDCERPTFKDIVTFLQRKNIEYVPN